MSLLSRKYLSSFVFLNATQFLAALNDNLYKLLLIFFLIHLEGKEHSNTILSLAGGIFVIPFLLFASLAGTLADRFSKRSVIYFTRFLEIITIALGVLSFHFQSPVGGYIVLFLMAVHSTLFSPCKYGIIPEIVSRENISRCNGIMTATTYLAIIFGTFLASFLTQITHKDFPLASLLCFVIAVLGAVMSLGIKKTKPQASQKRVSPHFISVIFKTLKNAGKSRYLLITLIIGAYFLFLGAYLQLNLIPFTLESLHLSEEQAGYLFLMVALGIGMGSFLTGIFSGSEVELGFVPLAAFGIAISTFCLFLFDAHLILVALFLVLIGLFGGFYIVPIDAFIQAASRDEDRGQNIAAANFLSFLGVIFASILIAFFGNVLKISSAHGFLIISILTVCVALFLFLTYADQVFRLLVSLIAKLFYEVEIIGKSRIKSSQPILLIVPRRSWIDTLIVMTSLPRQIRYIVPLNSRKKNLRLLYRLIQLIPIDLEHFSPIGKPTLHAIEEELSIGHSVCLMQPEKFPSKTLKDWEIRLEKLLKDIPVPILPIHISRAETLDSDSWLSQLKNLRRAKIVVTYGLEQSPPF